jgi:hypothetical protein
MSNQRAAMQRRNGPNQFNQPQYAPPAQKVRPAQFNQQPPQRNIGFQPEQQQPQPGVVMTVNEAITRITKRLVHVENKVVELESSGTGSTVGLSSNISSELADDTAINDILERINAIEDWIDSNNFEGFAKQLQLIQADFIKQTKIQNDKILKLETEMKKKIQQPILSLQQPSDIQTPEVDNRPKPRRFGGNKNVIQPQYNPNVLDLNIENETDMEKINSLD